MGRGIVKRKVKLIITLKPNNVPITKLRKKGEVRVWVRRFGMVFDLIEIDRIEAQILKSE